MRHSTVPAARRRLLRPALVSTVALGLVACAGLMGPRTIEVSRADMQAKLAQKFPIQKRVLGFLDITASRPQLTMVPELNRVSAQVDLKIDDTMFQKVHEGHVTGSFSLRYEPKDQTVRLDQVRLDELAMPTLPSYFLDGLQRLGNQTARDALQDYVVKQLKPSDLSQINRFGYAVQGMKVTSSGLAIELVPQKEEVTPAH